MNKRMIFGAILASLIMLGVGMASAVNVEQNEEKNLDKLDSPLFNIRTEKATKDKTPLKNIITNFLENRLFLKFSILNWIFNRNEEETSTEVKKCTLGCGPTARTSICPCLNNRDEPKPTIDICCPQVHSAAPPS